eukprot:TRINITY_DN2962_c0_g2_i1.p1 TRINITY_DN2962_c0_g2~~TRINITY_DN2962_c0_g2_i1.p1  ORF type:complete len:163 (+),score=45.90 TRINITY_DN2962_c0_g2_i1:52-540(+)
MSKVFETEPLKGKIFLDEDEPDKLFLEVTNTSGDTLCVNKRNFEGINFGVFSFSSENSSDIDDILLSPSLHIDGFSQKVRYIGKMKKRKQATIEYDFFEIAQGESHTVTFNIKRCFDVKKGNQYAVAFQSDVQYVEGTLDEAVIEDSKIYQLILQSILYEDN